MISVLSIAAGYAALIVVCGWWGVAAAAVHAAVMLAGTWRPR